MRAKKNFGIGQPPDTIADLIEVCKKIHSPQLPAIAMRGLRGANTNIWVFNSFLYAMGGNYFKDFPHNLAPMLDTPESINALEIYADLLRNYGVPGVSAYNFPEVIQALQLRQCAIIIDGAPLAGTLFDPQKVIDPKNIGVALVPKGPAGRYPGFDSHIWVIPKDSRHKQAAYLFAMWATSTEIQLLTALEGQMVALTRKSCWEDPAFKAKYNYDNGNYPIMYAKSLQIARPGFFPPLPEWPQIGDITGIAVSEAIAGTKSPKDAMQEAQRAVEAILRKAGYKW